MGRFNDVDRMDQAKGNVEKGAGGDVGATQVVPGRNVVYEDGAGSPI